MHRTVRVMREKKNNKKQNKNKKQKKQKIPNIPFHALVDFHAGSEGSAVQTHDCFCYLGCSNSERWPRARASIVLDLSFEIQPGLIVQPSRYSDNS